MLKKIIVGNPYIQINPKCILFELKYVFYLFIYKLFLIYYRDLKYTQIIDENNLHQKLNFEEMLLYPFLSLYFIYDYILRHSNFTWFCWHFVSINCPFKIKLYHTKMYKLCFYILNKFDEKRLCRFFVSYFNFFHVLTPS